MEIKQTRYVLIRSNKTEIICSSARNAEFWGVNDPNKDDVEAVEIVETLKSV